MTSEMILTYQTRFCLNEEYEMILQECANLLNAVERSLFAEVAKGQTSLSCKNIFLRRFGITARQFNACRVSLDGKIAACKIGQERAIASLKGLIISLDRQIQRLERKPSKQFILHQKKRRKGILSARLFSLEELQKRGDVRLCFGGKKLFHSQFYLEKNGFTSLQEWKECWQAKRNSEFFVLGSKDETGGNQTCTVSLKNGKLSLRLRLPTAFEEKWGKYLYIENIAFSYGQDAILAALKQGQAISYRFKKDEKGWRVFVSTALKKARPISQEKFGAIGLDLNVDHIACVETDRFGNPIRKETFSWVSYGKNRNRLKAITGDLCKKIVEYAKNTKKPLVIEDLDFQKKKLSLAEKGSGKFARLLSSFAYSLFFTHLMARAYKEGVTVYRVNPAFTSVIGRVNYSKRYGLSIHLAAALCIARRYQKFSEAPCSPKRMIPDGKGGHVAFVLPVRNRTKHVWHFWSQVNKKLKTVLAARSRAIIIDPRAQLLGSCDRKLPIAIGAIPIREPSAALLG
jgi:IS605 OrfB family transposase